MILNVASVNEVRHYNKYLGAFSISAGVTEFSIVDEAITEDSVIEVYFSENSKSVVSAGSPTYLQGEGVLTITFNSALSAPVFIKNVKVVA